MFERGLWTAHAPESFTALLGGVEMDAVSEQVSPGQRTRRRQALRDAHAESAFAVGLVRAVLGDVNVDPNVEVAGGVHARVEGLGRQRERGVRAEHHARSLAGLAGESPVFLEAGLRAPGAVAVCDLEGEGRPRPQKFQLVRDARERALDGVGARVVVDDGRGAGEQRVGTAGQGAGGHELVVERPVQAPPDASEHLDEIARWIQSVRHAAGKRRVEMMVGTDVAGDDQRSRCIDAGGGGRVAVARDDAAVLDDQVLFDNAGRGQGGDDQAAGNNGRGHGRATAVGADLDPLSRGIIARAAGESSIGRRVRRTPSNALRAPATAPAVGTRAISPTPFAP
jgi:hypothetical protein